MLCPRAVPAIRGVTVTLIPCDSVLQSHDAPGTCLATGIVHETLLIYCFLQSPGLLEGLLMGPTAETAALKQALPNPWKTQLHLADRPS